MQLRRNVSVHLRARHAIAPLVIAASLALAACGGSSSNATNTPSTSSNATQPATTQATGAATSQATSEPTATPAATATMAETATTAPTPTTAATATQAATTASGTSTGVPMSAASGLDQLLQSWQGLKSYKMTVTVYENGSSTPSVTGTVETVAPDKTHMVVTVAGQQIEMITIGDTSYLKLGGTWQKAPSGMTSEIPQITGSDFMNGLATPEASPSDVTKTGEDTINGVKCDVYEYKSSTNSTTVWIGQKDHMPYKLTSQVDTTRTEVLFSDFNANFDIQAPI